MKQNLKYPSQDPSYSLFDNWENLMRLEEVSERYRIPKSTLYDWKYRGEQKLIPQDLFVKFRRRLFVRKDVLNQWLREQISSRS